MNSTRNPLSRALAVAGLLALVAWCACDGSGDTGAVARSADGGAVSADPGASAAHASQVGEWSPEAPIPMRALLIGVGDYPDNNEFGKLRGPKLDVELMRALLIERFGADPDRVHVLVDETATVEGIVRAIDEHLIQRAQPGEEALIFYSGHGSRVFDPTGRERGHHDSSLVAWDSRIDGRRGSYDVTDDVLYSLLRPLTERGVHVVALTDACHSGGVLRDGLRQKFAAAGETSLTSVDDWPFWPEGIPFLDDDERGSRAELERYVHVAACTPEQRAFEYPFAEEGPHGLLTWALADVLRRARPEQTWADVAERAAARIQAIPKAPIQSIWVEGPEARRELFGSRFRPVPDRFVLEPTPNRKVVRVHGGSVHGLQPRTILRGTDEDGTPLGTLEVVRTAFGSAAANWLEPVPELPAAKALYGEVLEQPADLPKLEVHTKDERLLTACAGSAWAHVTEGDSSPYVLEIEDDRRVVFRTDEGIPIWSGELESSADPDAAPAVPVAQLEGAFRRETRFLALWQLADPDRRGQLGDIRLEFVEPAPEDLVIDDPPTEFVPADIQPLGHDAGFDHRGASVRGEFEAELPTFEVTKDLRKGVPLIGLRVTNENLDAVFLHILSINEAREVTPLYGLPDRPLSLDAPTKTFLVEPVAMSESVFPLERPMLERHLAIVSKVPLDLTVLENRVEMPGNNGHATRGEGLPGVLRACVGGGLTRSGGRVEHSESGWGVAWVDLWIRRAPR